MDLDPQTMAQIDNLAARAGDQAAFVRDQLARSHAQTQGQAAQVAALDPSMAIKAAMAADPEWAKFQEFKANQALLRQGILGTKEEAEPPAAPPEPAPEPADDVPGEDAGDEGEDGGGELDELDALELDDDGDVTDAVGGVVLTATEVKASQMLFDRWFAERLGDLATKGIQDPRLTQALATVDTLSKGLRGLAAEVNKLKGGETVTKAMADLTTDMTTVKAQLAELLSDQPNAFFDATARGVQTDAPPHFTTKNTTGPTRDVVGSFIDRTLPEPA